MTKGKKTVLVIFLAIISTVVIVFLMGKTKSGQAGGMGPGKGRPGMTGQSLVTVKSSIAKIETLNDFVITNGEVESQSAIDVFPSMSGKIASINVMLGSHVHKGDIIAKVDPSEPGTKYALSPIEAPITGSIVSSPVKIGEKVSTTTSITTIGDVDNLQISAPIPERYVSALKTGLKAEVTLEAYPGVIFDAYVSRVSPVVDKSTRTKEIILNFNKKDSRINAGMFAKVKLYTSKYEGKIVVPTAAIVNNEDQNYLFVVNEDDSVSKRLVTLGKTVDVSVQVLDNLKEGERVVIEGMLTLSEQSKVKDISNPKESKQSETSPEDVSLNKQNTPSKGGKK